MLRKLINLFKRLFVPRAPTAPAVLPPAVLRPDIPPINPAERLLNGRRAEALLNDPLLNAVFEAVAEKYRLSWENAPRGDLETQRVAHLSLAALKDLIGAIRVHLGNGKIFEADLAAKKSRDHQQQPY